ncbi:Gfo/Idh/MocA family protein [Butyrivibrio sp. VCD2006]|uniref:Gfo/Idh/MocA family protein n=1 Tax=Butyrivibrio sp. VCD2006 TaxID=1280664 RepID=UPI000412BB2C|nr:Gfo/Idh/MocA family oxidoreductase [Butyrivibrio sp. VCD2006]
MFNKKKVGILGTGDIARMMAKTLGGMKGVTCYAVASRTLEKAEDFAKEFRIKKYYGSYEELCLDPKLDMIYVATPHSEHYANVKLALEYGKNVLCEKAFMLNEAQAKEVFQLAKEKNLLLTEAMWTRFLPLAGKLKEILASNIIGEVSMVMADLSFNIAWKQRIQDPALGGGALLDLGIYGLTFASMVLGEDVTDIQSQAVLNDKGADVQDVISLKYRSGQMAVITCSSTAFGPCKGMIYGANGHIEVQDINNFSDIRVYNNAGEKLSHYKREKQITGYEYEVQAAFKAISEGWKECPEMPHALSLKLMNMMDFVRRQTGVKFPQETAGGIESDADSSVKNDAPLVDNETSTCPDTENDEKKQAPEKVLNGIEILKMNNTN